MSCGMSSIGEKSRGSAPAEESARRLCFWHRVIGHVFFVAGELVRHLLFGQSADLEDVIFSKERVRTHFMADEEQERNVVPIEEALAISDRDSLRTLIMNVVRGDVTDSLGSLALALDSEDTETSHYAASVLRDVLNDFRQHAQELYRRCKRTAERQGDVPAF